MIVGQRPYARRPIAQAVRARRAGAQSGAGFNPASIFEAGDIGAFIDPYRTATQLRSVDNPIPAAVGEESGFGIDLSHGATSLTSGLELVTDTTPDFNVLRNASVNIPYVACPVEQNKYYFVRLRITDNVGDRRARLRIDGQSTNLEPGLIIEPGENPTAELVIKSLATDELAIFGDNNLTDLNVAEFSVREIAGNHAVKDTPTTAMPILTNDSGVRSLSFDDLDDERTISFPTALGSNCTVVRAVPGVGTEILTGQTINNSFTNTEDHAGLIVINRPLTADQTENITADFDRRAGV